MVLLHHESLLHRTHVTIFLNMGSLLYHGSESHGFACDCDNPCGRNLRPGELRGAHAHGALPPRAAGELALRQGLRLDPRSEPKGMGQGGEEARAAGHMAKAGRSG